MNFLEFLKNTIAVCDGAMGTMIYSKGIYINQCFEHLNVTRSNLIKEIHKEYIQAGSDIIETNTFGANRVKLTPFGLGDSTAEINRIGASIAREVAGDKVFVAGSIGPLGNFGKISVEESCQHYSEQINALVEGGVDILMFETFTAIDEMRIAIEQARGLCNLPIVAQMKIVTKDGIIPFNLPEQLVKDLEKMGADVAGINCGVGPALMLEGIQRMRKVSKIYLAAMPNAGYPQVIDGRLMYLTTPEYMAEYAKRMIQSGVNIVGGCCGTTPAHIKAIKAAVRALKPTSPKLEISIEALPEEKEVKKITPSEKSQFAKNLLSGKFVVSIEINPPHGTNPAKAIEAAKKIHEAGIDAANIPDGPRATARMSPMSLGILFKQQVGIEPIIHYCCRDRNIIGMQADLLGANALGMHNVLIITGDPPKLGDYPDATAVFDIDSIGLVRIARKLNSGFDLAGNPVGEPTKFFIGVGANPGAINLDEEVERFEKKVAGGAEYVLTQPVYDITLLEKFLKRIEHVRIPILVGILPLSSSKNAEFLHNEVPGMSIPDNIRERMRKAGSGDEAKKEGILIAQEALKNSKDMVNGVYIMPPFGRVDAALAILEIL